MRYACHFADETSTENKRIFFLRGWVMKIIGVIPARYASSRFPGKPLADIHGRPMIWWVYQQAKKASKLDSLFVATDDVRIQNSCDEHSIPCVITGSHKNTSDRIFEVSQKYNADFYVCINGDEPLLIPKAIDSAIPEDLRLDIDFATNTITPIKDAVELMDPSNIKVVFDNEYKAMYMSRTPIPLPFSGMKFKYYKHIGVNWYECKNA